MKDIRQKTIDQLLDKLSQILVDTEDEEEFHIKSDLLFVGIAPDVKEEVFKIFGKLFNTDPDAETLNTKKEE